MICLTACAIGHTQRSAIGAKAFLLTASLAFMGVAIGLFLAGTSPLPTQNQICIDTMGDRATRANWHRWHEDVVGSRLLFTFRRRRFSFIAAKLRTSRRQFVSPPRYWRVQPLFSVQTVMRPLRECACDLAEPARIG